MAKLLILALFCVAIAASAPAPDFKLEDEPRALDVTTPEDDGELDFDDEPRSDDSELESVEGDDGDDDDYSDLVPEMRDDTEELANTDDSEALEPSDRQFWRSRRFRRWGRRLRRWGRTGRRWYNRYQQARRIWRMFG